jgi:CheY-like chemotaxis protein
MIPEKPHILVVDDQKDVAQTLTAPLAAAGMTLEFALDGEDGFERAKSGDFDLLVVDMKMPPGDWGGLWLLEQLKASEVSTPVLVMSGEGAKRQIQLAMRLGATDWVDKGEASLELERQCLEILARKQPNRGLHTLLDQPESQTLERKSSFMTPVDSRNPNVTQTDIQHLVGKSVVAMANTDGGHVVIGQADDGVVLGLKEDFKRLKNSNQDGFTLRVVEYCDNALNTRWEVLGLRLHWIRANGLDVAVIQVPKHDKVVALIKDRIEHIYIRRETRTDLLQGLNLINWSERRRGRYFD